MFYESSGVDARTLKPQKLFVVPDMSATHRMRWGTDDLILSTDNSRSR